ncbi:uncharacterized protein [Diadema antillarum]|uniref:uncharacterized protein n=1 Tax=Diadema antillarum TaxID=105358 RepID=UPI003A8AFE4A
MQFARRESERERLALSLFIAVIFVILIGLLANAVLIYALVAFGHVRRRIHYVLVVNLAVVNELFMLSWGVENVEWEAEIAFTGSWTWNQAKYSAGLVARVTVMTAMAITITALTVDQYLVIRQPAFALKWRSKKGTLIVCCFIWAVLDKALLKMERVKNQKGTIKSFFQVVPKAATVDQDLHDNGHPEKEPVLVTVQVPEETKSGQTPLQEKYPQLLDVMMNFVQLHGFGAHIRRRTGTATSCGVTLDDVRKHLLENVEGLDTISRTKVYYLMKPARVNSREAARHKDALDIRVGTKSCDVSKDNPNAHEYFATVSNVRQMCAMYPDECVAFSCDSKAKIHIGGQAVSRYHQLRTFFPGDDTPHYADHDFPVPGYLIEPDGYLQLQMKEAEAPSTKDKCGRDVVEVPSTGPLWVFNRTVKNTSTTIEDHMNDLKVIMKDNPSLDKPILVLVTDGGPDWTPKTNLNEFFLGKLWKEGKYDMLISTCMPAGLSRYNPIEHLWSPLSKFLAGVSLPACLPGETVPPALQSISPDEKLEKETIVFENALNRLNMYWDGRVHDGFRITSKAVLPNAGDENGTYTVVRNMFHSSLRGIRESSDLSEAHDEWKYISAHMDRRSGFVCFRKGSCGESTCKCMEDGVRASKVWKMPSGDKWLFPPITPDPEHPGHYKTLRQLERSLAFSSPDQHLKNFEARSCTHCRYIFTSKADEEKHTKLIHGGVRALRDANQDKASHRCPVCDQKYPTRYRLLKHQDEEGHKLKKGRPSKN